MKSKGRWASVGAVALIAASAAFFAVSGGREPEKKPEVVAAAVGRIVSKVSTTGEIEPRNRLKILPSVAGRVEEVRCVEGEEVRKGQVLALLSSSERAALLDAARLQGGEEQSYWKSVYRETAVLAPIDGQIIVRSIEPGQTVTSSDSLFVLSDRLIVKAYVDETDIGRVRLGQKAVIGLDAYPEIRLRGRVGHIYFESHLQNNVNIYYVDVIPESVPEVFRSGMSANIDIIVREKNDALLVPAAAVISRSGRTTVLLEGGKDGLGTPCEVETGISDEGRVEIVRGIGEGARVLIPDASIVLPGGNGGSNPFLPKKKKKKKNGE
ncbi:HlyD family efflux transporter periplasmic adaptor subunit [Chlorobium sp. N1]|uniref:efflux RND transporter periplasmic adaptor subunit n=1 Tax=Chlorobium sp. N1 TaxID=2491138 RepID=UPI0010395B54|nr:HlyD family efflux transporter periplasmic adaptor subunit [Chlorobium sp. N1]TCD47663.1 HlyD family efflux transporter periplasmic adaptor subunit [Chlorobium sp. N1]